MVICPKPQLEPSGTAPQVLVPTWAIGGLTWIYTHLKQTVLDQANDEMWNTATRTSARRRRRTSCVSAPGSTEQTAALAALRSPSISHMEKSWKSNVANGRPCCCTASSTFRSMSGFGTRTPVDGFTNSPEEFSPWHRRKIAPWRSHRTDWPYSRSGVGDVRGVR